MNKPLSKLLLAVGIVFTAVIVLETVAYLAGGDGLFDLLGGRQPPLLGAIAHQISMMPLWLFLMICALSVVLLSLLIALAIVAEYKKELVR